MAFELTHKPCNLDYCSSGFGTRHINVSGASTQHKGFDIPASGYAYAMAKGTVKEVAWNNFRGWYIVLKHTSVYDTEYQHLAQKPSLKVGTSIKSGQKIGIIGSTGVGARHLHIEIRKNGTPINPQPYLIRAFMPATLTQTLSEITGYNRNALAWRWYLDVAKLQANLKALGYYDKSIDGEYLSGTTKAVKKFQKANGLIADGIVGPNTRTKMNAIMNSFNKPITKTLNNKKYKTLYNVYIRQTVSSKSIPLGQLSKGKKFTATKLYSKQNGKYKWLYVPDYNGWICLKYNKQKLCKAV